MEPEENNAPTRLGPLEWVLCAVLVGIVATTFAQVIFRFVLEWAPPVDTEELAKYMFMWLAALGAAHGFKTKSHFALNFLVERLSKKTKNVVAAIVVFTMAIFLLAFIFYSAHYTWDVRSTKGPGTGLSKAVPASSMVVGGVLMLYYMLKSWLAGLRSTPHEHTARTEHS